MPQGEENNPKEQENQKPKTHIQYVKAKRPVMPAWEQKLIGRKDRYENTWAYYLKKKFGETEYGKNLNQIIDSCLDKVQQTVRHEIKTNTIFGQKLKRPFGVGRSAGYSCASALLGSESVRDIIKYYANQQLLDTQTHQYYSGARVAAELFAPSMMQKNYRSSVHFEDAYLAEFANLVHIIPDEEAILADMMEQALGIKDSNYTDIQWRTTLMPEIIRGSYQRQLSNVYDLILEDQQNDPSITEKEVRERMEQAEKALGKIYTDFSLNIANTSELLESPLLWKDSDTPPQMTQNTAKAYTTEETEKFQQHQTHCLITEAESKDLMKQKLDSIQKETLSTYIGHFYRALGGKVGPQDLQTPDYKPMGLSDPDNNALNKRCFLSAALSLKHFQQRLIDDFRKNTLTDKEYANGVSVSAMMMNSLMESYWVTKEEMAFINDPNTDRVMIQERFGVPDEIVYGVDKVEVPPVTTEAERQSSYYNMMMNMIPSKETVMGYVGSGLELVKDLTVGATTGIVSGVYNYFVAQEQPIEHQDSGLEEKDLFLTDDEINYQRQLMGEQRQQEEEKAQALELEKQRLQEQEALKAENARIEKERQDLLDQQAKEKKAAVDKELNALPVWQQKAIGHTRRFTKNWISNFTYAVSGGNQAQMIESGMEVLVNFASQLMAPKVVPYEIYGKNMGKAWENKDNLKFQVLSSVLNTKLTQGGIQKAIRRAVFAPESNPFISGDMVAVECFSPTYINSELRPPCHFSKADMMEFFNATGIVPDEGRIIGDMLTETLNVSGKNYNDTQWRKDIMPKILQGSFKQELKNIYGYLQAEYEQNPAITKELFQSRLENAGRLLGKMYTNFSSAIANNTEYLEAPIKFLDMEPNPVIPQSTLDVMTPEQKKALKDAAPASLISEKDWNQMKEKALKATQETLTPADHFANFVRAKSGIITDADRFNSYQPKPYNAENLTPEDKRFMYAALINARQFTAAYQKHGILDKIFRRSMMQEEKVMLDSIHQMLHESYGFELRDAQWYLNPQTPLSTVKAQLGLSDYDILGYRPQEIPKEDSLGKEQQGFMDKIYNNKDKILNMAGKGAMALGSATKSLVKSVVQGSFSYAKYYGNKLYQKLFGKGQDPNELAEDEYWKPVEMDEQGNIVNENPDLENIGPEELGNPVEIKAPEEIDDDYKSVYGDDEEGPDEDGFEDVQEYPEPEAPVEPSVEVSKEETNQVLNEVVGEMVAPEKGYLSWAWSKVAGWSVDSLNTHIDGLQNQIIEGLKGKLNQPREMLQEFGKLQYTQYIREKINNHSYTVDQGEEAIKENHIQEYGEKFAKTEFFLKALEDLKMSYQTLDKLVEQPELGNKIFENTMNRAKEFKQQQKKNEVQHIGPNAAPQKQKMNEQAENNQNVNLNVPN